MSLRQQPGDFPDADAAESIIGELVANALKHAYHDKPSLDDTILLALCDVPHGLVVIAADQSDEPPALPAAPPDDAESGRGLHLVAAFASSWGWEPRADGGKVVYAVIENRGADQ
jgi:anti-sigma regulatory factor (Ser/Thr protein kinase)